MWWTGLCGPFDPFSGVKSNKKLAKYKNMLEFQNQFMYWMNLLINRYKYNGLPGSVNERIIELSFLLRGAAMVAEVDGNHYSLMCAPGADYNIYGEPTKAWGYGMNGFNREFNLYVRGSDEGPLTLRGVSGANATRNYNAVMGWDNKARYPYVNYLIAECTRLADIQRSNDVIRANLKRPAIVACEETQVNTVRNAFKNKDENEDVIVISAAGLNIDSVKVWDLKTDPTLLAAFADDYERHEAQLRERAGLFSNPNQDKKERLLVDEVNANDEETQSSEDICLTMRQQFCEDLNNAFGLNVSVEPRNKPDEEVQEDDDLFGMEDGQSDGSDGED